MPLVPVKWMEGPLQNGTPHVTAVPWRRCRSFTKLCKDCGLYVSQIWQSQCGPLSVVATAPSQLYDLYANSQELGTSVGTFMNNPFATFVTAHFLTMCGMDSYILRIAEGTFLPLSSCLLYSCALFGPCMLEYCSKCSSCGIWNVALCLGLLNPIHWLLLCFFLCRIFMFSLFFLRLTTLQPHLPLFKLWLFWC